MIDARTQAALARLTDNEKECLRRRLRQQTAKQMALDLGISPHAAEKRLKMARTKLGLSSSLEAARLLAASEGYQQARPQGQELADAAPEQQNRSQRKFALGATAMVVIVAAVIAVLIQPSEQGATSRAPRLVHVDELESVEVSPNLARAFLAYEFGGLDNDKSGFVELGEVPGFGVTQGISPPDPQSMSETELQQSRRRWITVGDRDDDRRVSLREYVAWFYPPSSSAANPARS